MSEVDKARALRLSRLTATLAQQLSNADAALEVLVAEAALADPQIELWRALHAAGRRDGSQPALATAYQRLLAGRRLQQLEADAQVAVLMHAADFFEATGDVAATQATLLRAQQTVPGHADSFNRLERMLESSADGRQVLELYSHAAIAEPKGSTALASKAIARLLPLAASAPVSIEVCERLLVLVGSSPRLLEVLEEHCKRTRRVVLACAVIEQGLEDPDLPEATAIAARHRLVEMYVGEAQTPESAIDHIEILLDLDPTDAPVRRAAQKLLACRDVAGRAATALQSARRSTMPPPPVSQRPPPRSSE